MRSVTVARSGTKWRTSSPLAFILLATLATPVLAQDDAVGHVDPSVQEDRAPPFSGPDDRRRDVEEGQLDRWQREDREDRLEDRRERRDELRLDERDGDAEGE